MEDAVTAIEPNGCLCDPVCADPIKYQVLAMGTATNAGMFVTRNKGIGAGHFCQLQAALNQFLHKRSGSQGIIDGNVVADTLKVRFGLVGDDDNHKPRSLAI